MEVSTTPIYNESNISNVNGIATGATYSSDDDSIVRRHTQRKRNVSDSDSDAENVDPTKKSPAKNVTKSRIRKISNSDSDSQEMPTATKNSDSTKTSPIKKTKSRIRMASNSDSDAQEPTTAYKSSRIENRKTKLHDKFKALGSAQVKSSLNDSDSEHQMQRSDGNSEQSDEEVSCLKIKKKIITKKNTLSSICDADTSDEDVDKKLDKIKRQKKIKPKTLKSAIEIEPRMSAKQAMENMQKIKSESNRMLREKDVSLPYHKPRALSLQDIMKRKRPALTSDGKVMPIKMNNEQLAQYAKLLEERQKEIIELCKSDSEEEMVSENQSDMTTNTSIVPEIMANGNKQDLDKTCDSLYDTIIQETNNSNADISMENDYKNIEEENKKHSEDAHSIGVINENLDSEDAQKVQENVDSKIKETSFNSSTQENEIELKYLDSSTENNTEDIGSEKNIDLLSDKPSSDAQGAGVIIEKVMNDSKVVCQNSVNLDSQAISLQFESEQILSETDSNRQTNNVKDNLVDCTETANSSLEKKVDKDFSDDDEFDLENIDKIIENAEILKDDLNLDSPLPTTTRADLPILKPKLTGSPGMFIDLESGDQHPKIPTGVDLLKERFTYFSKLKTAEELDKNRRQKHKPGLQHLKLKHELEEQIAVQRSLEWEKRLEEEKKLKSEMMLKPEDDIEKIESKLEDEEIKESSSSEEEDLVEDDVEIKDVPRKTNPMIGDEAEESNEEDDKITEATNHGDELENNADENDSDISTSDESSCESDDEGTTKPKKGRILKAFEDSDDEINCDKQHAQIEAGSEIQDKLPMPMNDKSDLQDDEIQLAQFNRSISDDIFATQESQPNSTSNAHDTETLTCDIQCTADLGSQTFSILDSTVALKSIEKQVTDETISVTQLIDESKFDEFNKKSAGSLSQDLLVSEPQSSQSQEIGDDIAALCTGKFYDNPFVTQVQDNLEKPTVLTPDADKSITQEALNVTNNFDNLSKTEGSQAKYDSSNKLDFESDDKLNTKSEKNKPVEDGNLLKSILDELNEPEEEKTNRFFGARQESQAKKRFIIDSDEEDGESSTKEKNKKLKKRKPEKRALQISDDEEDEENVEDEEESEIDEDVDKVVEYDSEENEIEVQAKPVKKKRIGEFFENEAELTSEDEWMGSGDEDEADLDRMEKEEGDNEVFHQGQLQRELGEIHMREVLDQDKREVRLLQELLFEDGDLGDGHRQRKFRWKNDGDADDGTGMGDLGMPDTQEEEFESEELWRKQRHERELFLKSLQENEEEKSNTTLNRTALIKANLKTNKKTNVEEKLNKIETEVKPPVEPKSTKDLPSPKKQFLILKQSYHGSLLSRGQGALARLAALATPLAAEADAPRPKAATSAPGNFVFATLTQPDPDVKVTKRKAETKADTPRLLKKMKTDETHKLIKNSLFDHFTT